MITQFDDYCIHQTIEPVAQPSQSDRNFYDRYWFGGIDQGGRFMFEAALGLYPNRRVMDGHFSIAIGTRQHAFHASRRAPKERGETEIGPFSVQVIKPMRQLRVLLAPNDTGIECDLLFTASSVPMEEPKNLMYDDGHLIMHNSRFTQCGRWQGFVIVDGERIEVEASTTLGTRDKSWGVRPVGEPQGGAPGLLNKEPGVYWVWCPLQFEGFSTQFGTFEDRDGHPTQLSAHRIPLYAAPDLIPALEEPGQLEFSEARHHIAWEPGTRRAARASFEFRAHTGEHYQIECEPLQRFQMLGVGYNHPEWGHAYWKGELATGREDWDLDALDPLAYHHLHTHLLVRARCGDQIGYGTLETICIGRHAPSGFKSFFDGAEAQG